MTPASARLSLVTDEVMSLTADLRETTRSLPDDDPVELLEIITALKLRCERLIILLDKQVDVEREADRERVLALWNRNARAEKEYETAHPLGSKHNGSGVY